MTDGDEPGWEPPDYAATESAYARTYQMLVWDTRTGKRLLRRNDHYSLDGGTNAFVFVENGKKLLSCGMFSVDVWTIPKGKRIFSFTGSDKLQQESPGNSHRGPQRPFAVSHNGKVLAAGAERWSLPSFKLLATIPMYQPSANWLSFSPDGSKLVVITPTDTLAVWDLNRSRVTRWIVPKGWSTDTRVMFLTNDVVATYTYGNYIQPYNVTSGRLQKRLYPPANISRHANSLTRLSPDGKLLIGDVYADEQLHMEVWDTNTLSVRAKTGPCPPGVRDAVLSSDGRWLIVSAGGRGVVLYDLKNNTSRDLPGFLGEYAFSPDGSVLTGYKLRPEDKPGADVVMLDTLSGKTLYTLGKADVEYYRPAAFSPDGKRVAAVCGSRIRMYQADTGKPVLDLVEVGAVRQVAFSPDGRRIAGTSGLGVTLWDTATGKVDTTLTAVPPDRETGKGGFWFSIRSDGSFTGSAGADKRLRCVRGEFVTSASRFARRDREP